MVRRNGLDGRGGEPQLIAPRSQERIGHVILRYRFNIATQPSAAGTERKFMGGKKTPGAFLGEVYTFRPSDQAVYSTFRLEMFTDAILAIAATVLVLNLKITAETGHHGLVHQVNAQRPTLVSVALGFLWITGTWVLSHRSLRQLRGADHYMTLLVVAGALNITLIPFATLMLASGYGHRDFWVGVEAVSVVILIGIILSALGTEYAHRRDLLKSGTAPARRRSAMAIWYAVLGLAVIAVVIARFAPWVALALIVVLRVSALLPLGSDRKGLPGDFETLHVTET